MSPIGLVLEVTKTSSPMRLSSSSINPQVKAAGRDNSRRLAYVCLMWTTFDGQVKQYNNQSNSSRARRCNSYTRTQSQKTIVNWYSKTLIDKVLSATGFTNDCLDPQSASLIFIYYFSRKSPLRVPDLIP